MANFNYSLDEVERERSSIMRVKELLTKESLRHVVLEAEKDIAAMMKCPREGCTFKCAAGTKKHCRIHTHAELVYDGNF